MNMDMFWWPLQQSCMSIVRHQFIFSNFHRHPRNCSFSEKNETRLKTVYLEQIWLIWFPSLILNLVLVLAFTMKFNRLIYQWFFKVLLHTGKFYTCISDFFHSLGCLILIGWYTERGTWNQEQLIIIMNFHYFPYLVIFLRFLTPWWLRLGGLHSLCAKISPGIAGVRKCFVWSTKFSK